VRLLNDIPFSALTTLLDVFSGVMSMVDFLLRKVPGLKYVLSGLLLAGTLSKSIGLVGTLLSKWKELFALWGSGRGPGLYGGGPGGGPGGGGGGGGGGPMIFPGGKARSTALSAEEEALIAGGGGGAAGAYLRRGGRPLGRAASAEARFASKFGHVPGARYAGPASEIGSLGRFGRVGSLGMRGLGAAGKFAGPLALLSIGAGAFSGMSRYGGVGGAAYGATDAMDFGTGAFSNVFDPGADPQQRDANAQKAQAMILKRVRATGHTRGAQIHSLNAILKTRAAPEFGSDALDIGHGKERDKHIHDALMGIKEVRDAMEADQVTRAQGAVGSFRSAFHVYAGKGQSGRGGKAIVNDFKDTFREASMTGRRELSAGVQGWIEELSKGNAGQKRLAKQLTGSLRGMWHDMGTDIRVVNGHILTGSRDDWNNISKALSDSTERARQDVSRGFTRMQELAVGQLMSMGYKRGEAVAIIRGREAEAAGANGDTQAAIAAATGTNKTTGGAGSYNKKAGAVGMRVAGFGTQDKVGVAPGHIAAPGELIVNRHTEAKVDALLKERGTSLGRAVASETKPHSEPLSPALTRYLRGQSPMSYEAYGGRLYYAAGGRLGPGNSMPEGSMTPIGGRYGGQQLINPRIARQVRAILRKYHAQVSAGWAPVGTHAPNSDHHWGGAVDLVPGPGGSWNSIDALARWAEPSQGSPAHGFRWVGYTGDPGHGRGNHLHLSWPMSGLVSGIKGAAGGGGAGGGGVTGAHPIAALRSGRGGIPGAMANAAFAAIAEGINRNMGATGGGGGGGGRPTKGIMSFNQVARLAESVGLPGVTFAQIAKGESAFNPRAVGHDPGGTQGLGLWQITTKYNDDIIRRFGGREAMFNAHTNALAAKAIYDRAGIGAWYGTRYMTGPDLHYNSGHALGGRVPDWGGWNAKGGTFNVTRPTIFGAGEAGPESVTISRNTAGGGGGRRPVSIHIAHIDYRHPGDLRKVLEEELAGMADDLDLVGAEED
jgi:hypothetical protein